MANDEPLLKQRVMVLGATGYVGGRLVPRLLEAGYQVRAASRSIKKLEGRPWAQHPNIELITADVLDEESLEHAMRGCEAVYYLVHSMEAKVANKHHDFVVTDRRAAFNVMHAAAKAEVGRLIYLSGLGDTSKSLSPHLRSRKEVATILQMGKVPVTVFQAALIIGSGSASFEILRYLTDRLPIMITPKWVNTPCQPIAIRNVLNYLIGCLEKPETIGQTFDIGGPDIVTYRELIDMYGEEDHLGKRWIIPVPFFTPKLSSYWIHLITPVSAAIAQPLAEGLRNPVICQDNRIREIIPQELLSYRQAIQLALDNIVRQSVETSWTDAGFLPPEETPYPGDPKWAGGTLYLDCRKRKLKAPLEPLWHSIIRIGGKNGWYYGNWLWHLRSLLDKLVGGVGSRGGRRNPVYLMPGDALDFWRVLAVHEPYCLRLLAEMKIPGIAVLEFKLRQLEDGETEIRQTAWFSPRGLAGMLYWAAVFPFHEIVFEGMLRGITRNAIKSLNARPYG
jgi:uncharacterized protein YbjT (DUF2867 family)